MRPAMETVISKPALRATDRISQTVAALARLLDQTMNDLQLLDSEFQEQVLLNGEMASSVEAVRKELTAERDQLRLELEELKRTTAEWSTERAKLVAECERATYLLEQSMKQ